MQDVCGYEKDSMDTVVGYDARVIQCLQDYRWGLALVSQPDLAFPAYE